MCLLDWVGNSEVKQFRNQTAVVQSGCVIVNQKVEDLATSLFVSIIGAGYSDSVIRSDLNRPKGPGLYSTLAIDLATTFCAAIEKKKEEDALKAAA